ncbi:MAG TPA: IS481 family transposase [Streptosporangiaceae bacterium]|nr:IS481 family transposase [Streptosporangiaceae bacterium]
MTEQRYRAVLEVMAGVPVTEVADRYGLSRQSVHAWLRRYRAEGPSGLADRSHKARAHPWQIPADLESAVCELRRAHPRWGPRRLVFEMDRRGHGTVTRSTVYRVLVRNGLIEPKSRRRRRKDYKRWERPVPMQLWQLDVTASAFLDGGREVKIVTGIDDHSRYCVIAKAVMRATARPVCQAFIDAMGVYGVPDEVLSDNGAVFTGRFIKPRPAAVLFERICRENGITQRLTRPASPTTTGKIERLHQSLQIELLDVHGPFESLEALQAALDAWREEYNTSRPHQSLAMAFPASRFTPAASPLTLRVPAQLTGMPPVSQPELTPPVPASAVPLAVPEPSLVALEADRVVPPSGNLWIGGQQVWLGPALSGRTITIWVDETSLHVLLDGTRLKTLPSRLGVTELARLAADGARPAGPSPLPSGTGRATEVEQMVNATGLVGLAGAQVSVGFELAGQRVTLRMDGTQMAVISYDGALLRTLPCPVKPADRYRLRGARPAAATRPVLARPVTVQRRVSQRGQIMVATQRIQVGMIHARKTVTVIAEDDSFHLGIDGETVAIVPRTTTREIHRYKAHASRSQPSQPQERR